MKDTKGIRLIFCPHLDKTILSGRWTNVIFALPAFLLMSRH